MNIEERQAIEGRSLLLFDGLCAMCNGTIRFLMQRDTSARLLYAPIESRLGQEMLATTGLPPEQSQDGQPRWTPDGVVLMEFALTPGQRISARSDAAIRLLLLLPRAWPLLGRLLSWVPRGLCEAAYRFVARRRYRVFGSYATCPIPSPAERSLILGTGAGSSD